jgi:hypothetical protein
MQVTNIPFTISDLMAIFCRDCNIDINMINISPIILHLKKSPIPTILPPTDSWHQVDSDRCYFHALMPALTLVSLLERYLVL